MLSRSSSTSCGRRSGSGRPRRAAAAVPRPHPHGAAPRSSPSAWAALRERGLAAAPGRSPGSTRLLRLLAGPSLTRRAAGVGAQPDPRRRGRAGDEGVLARRHGDGVVLEPCTSLAGRRRRSPADRRRPDRAGRQACPPHASPRRSPAVRRGSAGRSGRPRRRRRTRPGRWRGCCTASAVAPSSAPSPPTAWGMLRRSAGRAGRARRPARALPRDPRRRRLDDGRPDRRPPAAPPRRRAARRRTRDGQSRSPWRISCRPDSVIEPDSDG